MKFLFFPLRFDFTANESLHFPRGKAANILRGALGTIFRRIACIPQCEGAPDCEIRQSCPYAKVFEPGHGISEQESSPSGLADWPRPFVFRARHLDGRILAPGEAFHFDLNMFSLDPEILPYFVLTFAALAREGVGPRRGKAELKRVTMGERVVYHQPSQLIVAGLEPVELDLAPRHAAPARIRVDFLSPVELKHERRIAAQPEFPILFGRVRDRIATLSRLYGAGPLEIDYLGTNARAAEVKMLSCHVRRVETERRSSKTGQSHPIGGFVGAAEYEGDLAEFLPYLEAAKWTGVGRQAVWGKGEIEIHPITG